MFNSFISQEKDNNHKSVRKTCHLSLSFVAIACEHVGTQSTQGALAHEHMGTQDTLAHEHVSMQGTLARENVRHAI